MSDSSANLSLPYLMPSQAQKHVTHNEALAVLDTVVQLAVVDRDRSVPPETPTPGLRHIVAADATGAWAGQAGNVAAWDGTAWRFLAPQPGWRAWVLIEAVDLIWRDGGWGPVPPPDSLGQIGVNTVADTVNRLAVAADATLLTHEGAGHQLKINKAAPGETASLLFQSGWSGRAEMGLAGNDRWSIKVSPDGVAWTEALEFDNATGRATGAAVQADATDATPGLLLAVGAFGLGGMNPRYRPPRWMRSAHPGSTG